MLHFLNVLSIAVTILSMAACAPDPHGTITKRYIGESQYEMADVMHMPTQEPCLRCALY